MEIRAGRGPIFFDISRINPDDLVLLKPQNGWQLLNYEKLRSLGMDLFRDNTEWLPQMTISYGGMHADVTDIPPCRGFLPQVRRAVRNPACMLAASL